MVQKEVTVMLEHGLHARPATEFIKTASKFPCKIRIGKEGKFVDAKSILGVMSLAVSKGQVVTLEADGSSEQDALEALANILSQSEV